MPAAQNRSKLADTSSQALPTAPMSVEGNTVGVVLFLFMALLSFRGISTPSLPALRRATPLLLFQHSAGQSPSATGQPPPHRRTCRATAKTPAAKANARDDDQGCESAGNGGARLSPVSFVPHNWPRGQPERRESWSEWQDLNLRPPRPERGELPDGGSNVVSPTFPTRRRK
jgi:hypothetical protein